MAIVQEDRSGAMKPQVKKTDYGAEYVTAATETPVTSIPAVESDEQTVDEAPAGTMEEQTPITFGADDEEQALSAVPEEKQKKKGGRPKKNSKK